MLQLEEKSQIMDIGVLRFFNKVDSLHKKGLPGLLVINDKLITLSNYKQKILTVAKDGSKFAGIQGSITGKAFLETLQLYMSIQHEINTSSSQSLPLPSTQRWMKHTEGYSGFPSLVKRDGNTYVSYSSRDDVGIRVSMKTVKVKLMNHQLLPPESAPGFEYIISNPIIL
jgi:hypothetical protein